MSKEREAVRKKIAILHPFAGAQGCSLVRQSYFNFGLTSIDLVGFRDVYELLRAVFACHVTVQIGVY